VHLQLPDTKYTKTVLDLRRRATGERRKKEKGGKREEEWQTERKTLHTAFASFTGSLLLYI